MSKLYSEQETLAAVAQLNRKRLVTYVEAEMVRPVQTPRGAQYRQIDIARLELLCELDDLFDLREDALCMVISLIDQLHQVRGELRAVLEAIEQGPDEARRAVGEKLRQVNTG